MERITEKFFVLKYKKSQHLSVVRPLANLYFSRTSKEYPYSFQVSLDKKESLIVVNFSSALAKLRSPASEICHLHASSINR